MTDPTTDQPDDASIPEAGPDEEPSFAEPARPAPTVADPPGRNTEF